MKKRAKRPHVKRPGGHCEEAGAREEHRRGPRQSQDRSRGRRSGKRSASDIGGLGIRRPTDRATALRGSAWTLRSNRVNAAAKKFAEIERDATLPATWALLSAAAAGVVLLVWLLYAMLKPTPPKPIPPKPPHIISRPLTPTEYAAKAWKIYPLAPPVGIDVAEWLAGRESLNPQIMRYDQGLLRWAYEILRHKPNAHDLRLAAKIIRYERDNGQILWPDRVILGQAYGYLIQAERERSTQ
jgi:hypothetical protein